MSRHLGFFARAVAFLIMLGGSSQAQTGWGVDGNGNLFSFDTTLPGSIPITSHGNLGFVPEGIDFRPGTSTLYAIEVGATTTQLYTVNTSTACANTSWPRLSDNGRRLQPRGQPALRFRFQSVDAHAGRQHADPAR